MSRDVEDFGENSPSGLASSTNPGPQDRGLGEAPSKTKAHSVIRAWGVRRGPAIVVGINVHSPVHAVSEVDPSVDVTVNSNAACVRQARKHLRVCRQLGGIESENREPEAQKAFSVASPAGSLLLPVALVGIGCSRRDRDRGTIRPF